MMLARNRRFLLVLDQVATFNDEFRQLWRDIRNLFVQRAERGLRRLQDSNCIGAFTAWKFPIVHLRTYQSREPGAGARASLVRPPAPSAHHQA